MKILFNCMLVVFSLLLFCGCGKKAPTTGKIEFSGPPGLVVSFQGKAFRKTPVVLRTRPGEYNFRLAAPGYYPEFRRVAVRAGEVNKVKVQLDPVRSAILIDSEPRGAKVRFQGEIRGATPLILSDLPAGEHAVQLLMPGYSEEQIRWRITDERLHPRMIAKLKMTSGRIVVKTVPDTATVFINGKRVGLSPYSSTLESGVYALRIEREGFNSIEEQVIVPRGGTVRRDIRLETTPGTIKITSSPSGAEVFLNDKKVGVTPWTVPGVQPGNYRIRAAFPGYDFVEKTVSVAPSQTENVHLTLARSTGSASFVIRPAGVQCLVDGRLCGVVQAVGDSVTETRPIVVENLSPGKHVLTVTHPRALPVKKEISFTIAKGKRYTAREKIELWVSNCEITFKDGRVESGMIYSEDEKFIYYSPTVGIRYPVQRNYIRTIKYIPVTAK